MSNGDPIIRIDGVSKRFGRSVIAVDNVSLNVARGEFFALLGPSGCGKTTLLRMLAGFEVPDTGAILIDGQDMGGIAPNRRPVNMVFQSYAVFPHMTVSDNVAYGLDVTRVPRRETQKRVGEAIDLVQLGGLEKRKPDQLSGGQQQRVALARALVKQPKVLLLDEPLSALDAKLRETMRAELVSLQKKIGITFVIVTHDQEEALSMADRIAVMNEGRVCQVAVPTELYESPADAFVAGFIGRTNQLPVRVLDVEADRARVDIEGVGAATVPSRDVAKGAAMLVVRPEKIAVDRGEPGGDRLKLVGRVTALSYYGDAQLVTVTNARGASVTAQIQISSRGSDGGPALGDTRWCSWAPGDALVLKS